MRVLYITAVDLSARNGAPDHVMSICEGLSMLGNDVTLVAPVSNPVDGCWERPQSPALKYELILSKSMRTWDVCIEVSRRAMKCIATENGPDIVYLRCYPMDYVLLARHLRKLNVPFVCEFNTILSTEYRTKSKALRGAILTYYQAKTAAVASGWLPVTGEIEQWVRKISRISKPSMLASNGFRPEDLAVSQSRSEVRAHIGVSQQIPVIAMLGYGGIAHGYDRAIETLADLDSRAELWLVGGDESAARKANLMAKEYGVQPLVKTFPWMRGEKMANLISAADIGLGPLALDRKEMREAQPLKVRTYLGLGLRVVLNYIDPVISESLPFVTSVISTESRELASAIEVALAKESIDPREIKRYAEGNLSWHSIAKRTADFMDVVVEGAKQ